MDFREILQSDEWHRVYDRLLYRWKQHITSMQNSKTWEEFVEYRSRAKEVFEILRMPLDKLPAEDAVQYRDKTNRSEAKILEEVFND